MILLCVRGTVFIHASVVDHISLLMYKCLSNMLIWSPSDKHPGVFSSLSWSYSRPHSGIGRPSTLIPIEIRVPYSPTLSIEWFYSSISINFFPSIPIVKLGKVSLLCLTRNFQLGLLLNKGLPPTPRHPYSFSM